MSHNIQECLCDLDDISRSMREAVSTRDWSQLSRLTYEARSLCSSVVSELHFSENSDHADAARSMLAAIIEEMDKAESACLEHQQEILLQAKPIAVRKSMNKVYSL